MTFRLTGRRRARAAAVLTLALAAMIVPTAAHASETPGGTRIDPVPLPIATLDESFVASNAHVDSDRGTGQYRNNVAWYSLTPAADVAVSIRATSLEPFWDNTLEVWAGDVMVGQVDDRNDLDAAFVVDLEAGTTYLIGLGSYSRTGGEDWFVKGSARLTFSTRVPSAPTGLVGTPLDGGVALAWTAPTDLAGGIDTYEVLCAAAGEEEDWCDTLQGWDPETAVTVRGLTNGEPYTFRVVATNLLGESEASAPVTVTPQVPTTTTVTVDPAELAAGQTFDVRVEVAEQPDAGDDEEENRSRAEGPLDEGTSTRPAVGTVDVTVGDTSYDDLELVDGVAVVDGVVATGGTLTITARYAGSDEVQASSGTLELDVARLADSVTLEVSDLILGQQVRPVTTSASGLPVTLGATGACTAADGVLTGTGAGDCVVTASTAGDRDTQPATATATVRVTVADAALGIDLAARPGDRVAGTVVTATGQGLQPGSEVTLVVHSTPRTFATGVVGADGTIVLAGDLPAGLEVGAHRVVVNAVAFDGTVLTSEVAFTVASDGTFLAIGGVPAVLAVTGAEPAGAAGLAAAWIVLGAGLVLVARRRAPA
ncbi:fibronectin type III domain-containing protein [Cellulomonas sp. Sa3CUA2]|uniref:Fibronectin type III domain-containing protein n=1 Tax=Cellulomonas avistercoris TaxID=2762242 RepID=A0ABR8QDN6_9CELL|nr:fibronectin type III domain-containing protein [Cellulomonas avistercoris]MBD7918490.1 fibronectin type III domain-containing protein [Cellulomonas avistercoris]